MEVGTGASVTFSTGFFAEILSMDISGITRAAIPSSHLGTTGGMTFAPGALYDPGEMSVELQFDPDADPPLAAVAETCTITFASGATFAASAFLTEEGIRVPLEDRVIGTYKVKFSGAITRVDAV